MACGRSFHLNMALLMACAVIPSRVNAQAQDVTQQNQSVADAARRNREQKKNLLRRARVISDDDLDRDSFRSSSLIPRARLKRFFFCSRLRRAASATD